MLRKMWSGREVQDWINAHWTSPSAELSEPVAYADKIAFESAMKAGKGCDVWPSPGDYTNRTGRAKVELFTRRPDAVNQSCEECTECPAPNQSPAR
jgi:hypothetical protein